MKSGNRTEKKIEGWRLRSWLWVVLYSAAIFSTVPVARTLQTAVYGSLGKEFITYTVFSVIGCGLLVVLYVFIFKFKIKSVSQYVWLLSCAGIIMYVTIQLKKHPEEALHLLEYGLLAYFIFNTLSHRIKDRTIYLTALLLVSCVGAIDEFLQWLMPARYWDYRDVGINTLAGAFFLLAVWKGIKPEIISQPVRKISVKMLVLAAAMNLLLLSICVSNTPGAVKKYTAVFHNLSWLRSEEVMTEFGHEYFDPEIGFIHTRLSLENIKKIDSVKGEIFGEKIKQHINNKYKIYNSYQEALYEKLFKMYTPYTHTYLHEFLRHVSRRDDKFEEFIKTKDEESRLEAFKENQIVEKYYGNTLKNSGFFWPSSRMQALGETASLRGKSYISSTGRLITFINQKTAWMLIAFSLAVIWISGERIKRRLDD